MSEKPVTALSADDLKEILRTVIQEARKAPEPTADELAKKQQELDQRKQLALLVHQKEENRKREQNQCTHMRMEDGSARTVYVQNGNFIICQECQKVIRPETDLQEFNRFFILSKATRTTF